MAQTFHIEGLDSCNVLLGLDFLKENNCVSELQQNVYIAKSGSTIMAAYYYAKVSFFKIEIFIFFS